MPVVFAGTLDSTNRETGKPGKGTNKNEKGVNWGVAYTPEMDKGGQRPRPRWDTLRDQVREATDLGYDTAVAVETQHDPFLALAGAAREPSPIELSTGIAL